MKYTIKNKRTGDFYEIDTKDYEVIEKDEQHYESIERNE